MIKGELEKLSRGELEDIIAHMSAVIERFNIIPEMISGNFMFDMDGKTYNAAALVNMWELRDKRSICDVCSYKTGK